MVKMRKHAIICQIPRNIEFFMHEVRSTYIIQPTNCAHILCRAKFDSVKSYLTRNTHLDGAQNKGHKKKLRSLEKIGRAKPMMSFRLSLTSRCVLAIQTELSVITQRHKPPFWFVWPVMIDGHLSFSAICPFIWPQLF